MGLNVSKKTSDLVVAKQKMDFDLEVANAVMRVYDFANVLVLILSAYIKHEQKSSAIVSLLTLISHS